MYREHSMLYPTCKRLWGKMNPKKESPSQSGLEDSFVHLNRGGAAWSHIQAA
jgi:hypothetical protein